MKGIIRKDAVRALALFVFALAIRAIYLFELSRSPFGHYLLGDGIAYDAWARRITAGDWWGSEVFYQSPLYPYLLAIIHTVAGTGAVRIIQAVAGAVSCVLVAFAGRRFFGEREGWAAGILLALYPPALFFDGEIGKSSFDLLFSAILLLLIAGLRDRADAGRAIAAGVVAGLFALNRENALLLLPLIAVWLGRIRLSLAAMFVAGAMAMLLPVALRNRAIGGELLLTTSQLGTNFYIGNHEGADGRYQPLRRGRGSARYEREDAETLAEQAVGRTLSPAEVSDYWLDRGLRFVREQPGPWAALMARKAFLLVNRREIVDTTSIEAAADFSRLLRALNTVFHFGVLLPLAVAGMWITRRRFRELGILHVLLAGWALSVIAFYVLGRYRYPLVPILAMFAGAAVVELVTRRRQLAAIAVMILAAVIANWPLGGTDPRAPAYANLGNAMAEAGKGDDGARMLERAVALSPNFAEAHLALGHLRLEKGDGDAAEVSYRRTVQLDPGNAAAWNNLGLIAARRGLSAEASEMFERAVAADARDTASRHNLARFRLAARDFDGAAALYQQLVAIDDRDAEAHYQLANLLAFRNDYAGSRRHYERTLALEERRAEAHFKLAVVLDRLGDKEGSKTHLSRAVELNPKYANR